MRTVQRFSSCEDLKAAEGPVASMATVLKRHCAFARLIADLRDRFVREAHASVSDMAGALQKNLPAVQCERCFQTP
jgi:hypothetical protein